MRFSREALYTQTMLLVLPPLNPLEITATFAPALLVWGWLLVLGMALWLIWDHYKFIVFLDYLGAIKWTILQVTLPETAEETPKSMENAIALWSGLHKAADLYEMFFEGYTEWWYSLEVQCEHNRVRYYLFIPDVFRQFFEGVIYGQYPEAHIREAPDYTFPFDPLKVREEFEVYGTDMIFARDDIYPFHTYTQYADPLSPNDTFIDPHQALIEAYSNVNPGEQYWFQIIVKPMGVDVTSKWVQKGEKEIARITGRGKAPRAGFFGQLANFFTTIIKDIWAVSLSGKAGGGGAGVESGDIHFFDPVETAKMEGILRKISRETFPTTVRIMHIAPKGNFHKPNIGRAIGAFKQFNTFHLNSFKPDQKTKSNGVDYILKDRRREFRERQILAFYRWRDPGLSKPNMMTSEEIATLYHFPTRWVKTPVLERVKSGTYSAPDNVPYV